MTAEQRLEGNGTKNNKMHPVTIKRNKLKACVKWVKHVDVHKNAISAKKLLQTFPLANRFWSGV